MLTIRGVARELGISEKAVRRWVSDGVIPSTKCGNRVYIDPEWMRDKLERDGMFGSHATHHQGARP